MPQGDVYNIPWVIKLLSKIDPSSILDIGIGNGSYGFLIRQYLDIAKGRLSRDEWELIIDGIEVFPDYKNPVWDYFYNNIIIGNILDLVGEINNYDVILLLDVIEHFSKDDGTWLLEELLKKTDYVVITTPKGTYHQSEVFGNIHEAHLSEWRYGDFDPFNSIQFDVAVCHVIVIAKDESKINKVKKIYVPRLYWPSKSFRSILKRHILMFYSDLSEYFKSRKSKI